MKAERHVPGVTPYLMPYIVPDMLDRAWRWSALHTQHFTASLHGWASEVTLEVVCSQYRKSHLKALILLITSASAQQRRMELRWVSALNAADYSCRAAAEHELDNSVQP